jgi:hypothetical protein
MQGSGPMASIMQITNVWNATPCSMREIIASREGTQRHYFLGDVRQLLNLMFAGPCIIVITEE